jgi:hypothetical protein
LTVTEIDALIVDLSNLQDKVYVAIALGTLAGIGGILGSGAGGIGIPIAVAGVFMAVEGGIEAYNIAALISFLTDARAVAAEKGSVRIVMYKNDKVYGGVLPIIEYENPTGNVAHSITIASPFLAVAFSLHSAATASAVEPSGGGVDN